MKDPTKRCRYYCAVEEKILKPTAKKAHPESKETIDQQHLHKVISHEEINKKEKPTKTIASSRVDVTSTSQPRASSKPNDYLNSSYGKKLKKIAPHPGPSLINHTPFPGVFFKDANLAASSTSSHLSKLRRILPATQKPPLPTSPANSPRKLLEHLTQQANHIPAMLSSMYVEKTPMAASCSSQKPAPTPSPAPASSCTAAAPSKNRKTPPAVKRTISFEDGIPQTVRQLNCDHEVVAKTAGAELSHSPVKEKSSKSWLLKGRKQESGSRGEELCVKFVITSEEGVRIEADTCEGMCLCVF